MKTMLCAIVVGAACLLGSTGQSQAQMWWGDWGFCGAGKVYDAKRDVCVSKRHARRMYRKKRRGM